MSAHFEKWWSLLGILILLLFVCGGIGTVAYGTGWIDPPSVSITYTDSSTGQNVDKTITATAPRWPFLVGIPAVVFMLLAVVAGIRLSHRNKQLQNQVDQERVDSLPAGHAGLHDRWGKRP